MNRPRSANQAAKKIYLGNKASDQYKVVIPPESLPDVSYKPINNFVNRDNFFNEEISEELNLITNQWDDLGITTEYRAIFINHLKFVSESKGKR